MLPDKKTLKGVGAILINQSNQILLQKRTLDAPNNAGLVAVFGGGVERGETWKEALTRELFEELEFNLEQHDQEPIYLTSIESGSTPGLFNYFFIIKDIDDTNLVLHEGEAIIKVKKISDIPEQEKSYGLKQITDNLITKALFTSS